MYLAIYILAANGSNHAMNFLYLKGNHVRDDTRTYVATLVIQGIATY